MTRNASFLKDQLTLYRHIHKIMARALIALINNSVRTDSDHAAVHRAVFSGIVSRQPDAHIVFQPGYAKYPAA